MNWVRLSLIASVVTVVFVSGALLVANAAASGSQKAFANLPPELSGLRDIPADQRFAHFRAAQVTLADKDGRPISITVTPGKAAAVSATSITLDANDGSTRTFALDSQTATHGQAAASGDNVVVVTLDGRSTATAVVGVGQGWHGHDSTFHGFGR